MAALASYKKNGVVPVSLTALIKNGKDYDLIPIGEGLPQIGARLAQLALDRALTPVVEYVNQNDGSYPVLFFLSCTAQGGLKDLDSGDVEDAKIIINAVKTQNKRGKTNTYKPTKDGFVKLTHPKSDVWSEVVEEEDLPGALAQGLLDMVWISYIVKKNLSLLNNIAKYDRQK